jgi:FkbM family methyltransferase
MPSLKTRVRTRLMPTIAGAVRIYTRYAPIRFAKQAIVNKLSWWPYEFTVSLPGGLSISGVTSDYVQRRIFYYGVWEPSVTKRMLDVLQPGDVFVDVGANIGYHTLLAATRIGPSGRVVAIESTPSVFEALVRNVRQNGLTNVRCVNVAAAALPGRVTAYRCIDANVGGSNTTGHGPVESEGEVRALPVDEILLDDERRRVRLVKVDVEGTEADVCRGMHRTLQEARHALELVVEVTPAAGQAVADTAVAQFFQRAGFRPYVLAAFFEPPPYRLSRPTRLQRDARGQTDVLFSRAEADAL